MCVFCVCLREGVFLGPSCFSLSPPLGQLTQQVFSCKEELVQFGPLYGNLRGFRSGSIKIMQDDPTEVSVQRYVEKQVEERGWMEVVIWQSPSVFLRERFVDTTLLHVT